MFAVANIVIQSAINSLGTIVMAASSAAYNIEIITYDILNAFSQACTTFVGQNNGARQYQRCKKILFISILEGLIALGLGISIVFFFGRNLLAIFNNNPEVIETGYIRLMLIMITHIFSLLYEVMSGYLRGFWYFSFAGNIDYDRGLRYPYYLGKFYLSYESYIYQYYAGISTFFSYYGYIDFWSLIVLSPG